MGVDDAKRKGQTVVENAHVAKDQGSVKNRVWGRSIMWMGLVTKVLM